MNAPIRKFAAALVAAAAGAALSGCVGAFDPQTDPTSPVAGRVQTVVDANRRYPRWENFPKATPEPELLTIAAGVNTLNIAGGALADEAARLEWTLSGDPAAFASEVQARVDQVQVAPVTRETQAEMEEFLRRTRERGTAPPPVDRR